MAALVVGLPPGRIAGGIRHVGPGRLVNAHGADARTRASGFALLRHAGLVAAVRLLAIGLALGWVYGWAGPRLYPADTRFGFVWGMAHGACMPMALPALVLGRDVEIYSPLNTGRSYKLGYIAGINVCGLVFFGGAFWRRPPRASPPPSPPSPPGQNHQER